MESGIKMVRSTLKWESADASVDHLQKLVCQQTFVVRSGLVSVQLLSTDVI